jgi:hypothetical protein
LFLIGLYIVYAYVRIFFLGGMWSYYSLI